MTQSESELPVRTAEPTPEAEPTVEKREGENGEAKDPALPGTLLLLMLFLAAVVGLWGTVYWMLLTR